MSFEHHYQRVRSRYPDKLPFADVPSLLGFLNGRDGSAAAKNRALRALVATTQFETDAGETSTTLLLLALWPGLDAARSRLRRRFPEHRDELEVELPGQLTVAVRDLDLSRVDRIASTLLRNLERDCTRAMIRLDQERPAKRPVEDVIDLLRNPPEFATPTPGHMADVAALRGRLQDVLGADTYLVLLIVVGGCSQREAAAVLGISHDGARKRFQRAVTRLEKFRARCPNPET